MAMIDVYGISESGKKVKVGQVDESQIVDSGNENFYIGKIVSSSNNTEGTEYVYGFTSDNEKVIIGTVEEAAGGYEVYISNNLNLNKVTEVEIIDSVQEEPTITNAEAFVEFIGSGQTLTNIISIKFAISANNPSVSLSADKTFGLKVYNSDGSAFVDETTSSYSTFIWMFTPKYIEITFTQDTSFTEIIIN